MNFSRKPQDYKIKIVYGWEFNCNGKLTLCDKVVLLEGKENYLFPINNIEYIKSKVVEWLLGNFLLVE